jgi:DNA helicase HerA-like ATPase
LKRVVKLGRVRGIDAIFVSQRPAEIPRIITSQTEKFVIFSMSEPSDIKYIRAIIGPEADNLPTLEKLHYIEWEKGEIKKGIVEIEQQAGKAGQADV